MTTAHSHRAIIATMRDSQIIEEIIALRDEMPIELRRHLVGPLSSSHNLYVTFVMIPHGTTYDDDLGEWRSRFATLLRSSLTRPSLAVDMVK